MSQWTFPRAIAHRCGGALAPENTIMAIDKGMEFGYRAVEFDVMLSKDNVPMIMHDDFLSRTVRNSDLRNEMLCNIESSTLVQLDVGSWFNEGIKNVCIPLFEDFLQYCIANNVWMNIEIKPAPGFEEITGKIVAEMTSKYFPPDCPDSNYPLFSSFSYEALLSAKVHASHIPRGYLIRSLKSVPDWRDHMVTLEAIAVHTDQKHLSRDDIDVIKRLGYGLACYTVNSVERFKELLDWGVDACFTDRIDLISPNVLA